MFNLRTVTHTACLTGALLLASCADVSFVQTESPANKFKDFTQENLNNKSVIGVGSPISQQKLNANALLNVKGRYDLEDTMFRMAKAYNVAIRWGNGVRRSRKENILIQDLKFDEVRNYIEDVYNVQIIREGERRLLLLPSASEPRVAEFSPGRNVSLSQAVNGLAQQCGFNIVIAENQSRLANTRITTSLKDVTCYDAFAAILNPHGFSLEDKGGYFNIGGLPTRQWTLNLHEPDRDDERSVSYSSSQSTSDEDTGNEQDIGGTASTTVTNERRLWEQLSEDLEDLLENACADFEQQLSAAPSSAGSSLLPPPDGSGGQDAFAAFDTAAVSGGVSGETSCGYVSINTTVGLVQMRAPQTILDEANEIITKTEDIAGRRLILEARVLAVRRDRDFQQGASTALSQQSTSFGPSSITAAVNQTLVDLTTQNGLTSSISIGDLTSAVRIVEEFGTTYQLMQPTLELVDRQQATLIDGSNQPFIVRTVTTETTDTGVLTNTDVDLRYQFLGMQFSAAAQIADEGEPHTISIQIPIISSLGDFQSPIFDNQGNQTGSDAIPIAETRLIDQKVRLRDGEIKVIGGLTRTLAIDTESGVPLFRDVPIAGKALGAENIQYENVEFVVLLQARRIY